MKVEVVYALPDAVDAVSVSLPPGATLRDAVVASGVAQRHPEIDLEQQAFGVFGRRALLETAWRRATASKSIGCSRLIRRKRAGGGPLANAISCSSAAGAGARAPSPGRPGASSRK